MSLNRSFSSLSRHHTTTFQKYVSQMFGVIEEATNFIRKAARGHSVKSEEGYDVKESTLTYTKA